MKAHLEQGLAAGVELSLTFLSRLHIRFIPSFAATSLFYRGGAANAPEGIKCTEHWPNGHFTMAYVTCGTWGYVHQGLLISALRFIY